MTYVDLNVEREQTFPFILMTMLQRKKVIFSVSIATEYSIICDFLEFTSGSITRKLNHGLAKRVENGTGIVKNDFIYLFRYLHKESL